MDARTLLIAFGFAALAAGFVALGWQGQERHAAARAEQAAAAAPAASEAGAQSPALAWLQDDLASQDRMVLAMLCVAAAGAAYLWLLFAAFSESLAWGFVSSCSENFLGALAFSVFGSRRSLAPIFIMTSAYGLLFLLR